MGLDILVKTGGSPDPDLAAAAQVEIWERMGQPATYRLRYPVDVRSRDLPFLVDSRIDPGTELSILAAEGQALTCLVKGPVRGQSIHLVHGGSNSWVDVSGVDSSIGMDRESKVEVWKDVTDADAISSILSGYGYALDVDSTDAGHFEDKHTLVQRETDYHFVQRLARRNGCLFWITCDDSGVETAHFRRPPLEGSPAAQLLITVDGANVTLVDLTWDVERPTRVSGSQLDLNNKGALDGAVTASPQTALGARSLESIAGSARTTHLFAPADDAGDLQARGQALLLESDWFVRATCQTSKYALKKLVRAHTVVELNGVGTRYSGLYFVAAVQHLIDDRAHQMNLTLVRNAWSA